MYPRAVAACCVWVSATVIGSTFAHIFPLLLVVALDWTIENVGLDGSKGPCLWQGLLLQQDDWSNKVSSASWLDFGMTASATRAPWHQQLGFASVLRSKVA